VGVHHLKRRVSGWIARVREAKAGTELEADRCDVRTLGESRDVVGFVSLVEGGQDAALIPGEALIRGIIERIVLGRVAVVIGCLIVDEDVFGRGADVVYGLLRGFLLPLGRIEDTSGQGTNEKQAG